MKEKEFNKLYDSLARGDADMPDKCDALMPVADHAMNYPALFSLLPDVGKSESATIVFAVFLMAERMLPLLYGTKIFYRIDFDGIRL